MHQIIDSNLPLSTNMSDYSKVNCFSPTVNSAYSYIVIIVSNISYNVDNILISLQTLC